MKQLDFPVQIKPASPSQVPAILSELQFKLKRLLDEGVSDCIDLHSLPLFPGDYETLKNLLGRGEIHVSMNAMGPSEIYETSVSGIWWLSHSNSLEENVAEYIEITPIPEILKTEQLDIERGEQKLRQILKSLA